MYTRKELLVFNVTLNNISVISWWSVLLVEETEELLENHKTHKTFHIRSPKILVALIVKH